MTTKRKEAGGSAWRTLVPRTWARPPGLVLLGLALVGLLQAGCRSDGCSTCGGFGSRISNGVQALSTRLTKHFDGCGGGDSCGCGAEGTVIDSGIPVVPGGIAVPAPGTIVPAPAIESAPSQLEPIPSNSSTGAGGSNPASTKNAPGGNNRSGYTTMAPKGTTAQRVGSGVSRALLSTSDGSNRSGDPRASTDLFDNLPPVDLSSDVTRKAVAASPTPAAATTTPAPAPATPTAPAPVSDNVAPTPAEKVSAAEGAILSLPPINAVAPQAPGIRRFASMAPSVAGGSSPSLEGLDWLKEKGYRTFVDLRRGAEIDPNFVDAVNDRNMVYISLPIVANRLDSSRLARFDDLIAQSGNRPLYFCDSDGTRAGLVWYIHLRVVGQEDSQAATGKAEEIGLTVTEVKLAEDFIATQKPKARAAMARVATATPPDASDPKPEAKAASSEPPATPPPALPTTPAGPSPVVPPTAAPSRDSEPTPSMLPGEHRPQAATSPAPPSELYRSPASWRPVAALVLTGIGVPLAFWTRSALSESRSIRRRASLPAAAPRPLDALPASDA